jgi:predicted transcriptional regulator of viral defense system
LSKKEGIKMSGAGKLDDLLRSSKGIITAKFATAHGVHREYLSEFVRLGKLERISHGIYITPNVWEDKMLILQLRKEKMIYSHETALFLHGLADRNPTVYCVTVPAGYHTSKLYQEGLIVHTVKKDFLELGICVKQTVFGNDVKTYSMERSICDILRDRHNRNTAVMSEALKRYIKNKDKNLDELMRFAIFLRVEKILRSYLDVLL